MSPKLPKSEEDARRKVTYQAKESEINGFKKVLVGFVINLGISYNIQDIFNKEGYILIQVTSIGAKLCLIKDKVQGAMKALLEEVGYWLHKSFTEVRP